MTKLEKQAERRKELFMADLQALLDRHGATLLFNIDEYEKFSGVEVEMPAIYGEDNKCVEPYCVVDIPGYMPPTKEG